MALSIVHKLYSIVDRIIENIIKWRFPILFLGFTIFFAAFYVYAQNLTNSDNSMPVWMKHNDPVYAYYQKFTQEFDNDRLLAVSIRVPYAFGKNELEFTKKLSERFKALKHVTKVLSITEYESIKSEDDSLVIKKPFETIPQNESAIEILKKEITEDPVTAEILTNTKQNITAFYLYLDVHEGDIQASDQMINEVEQIIKEENKNNYEYYMAGRPVGDTAFNRYSVRDQRVFLPLLFLLITIVTFVFFRNIYVSILPMTVMIFTVIVIIALYFVMGNTLNAVTAMMGTILIAVCVADSVHMMLAYYENEALYPDKLTAIKNTARQLLVPCFFTALTTFAGFLSFNASPLVPNQVLGQYSSAGVMLAYVLTIFFLPILIWFLPRHKSKIAIIMDDGAMQTVLNKVFKIVSKHTNAVFYFFMAITLISLWGTTKVGVETNVIDYFPKQDKTRQGIDHFEQELSGANTAELIIESTNKNYSPAVDPVFLNKLETFIKKSGNNHSYFIAKTITYSEYVKKLNQAFHNNDPAYYSIPNTTDEIAQLLLLAESAGDREIARYKTVDNQKIRINIKSHWRSSESMHKFSKTFTKEAQQAFSEFPVKVQETGGNIVWLEVDDNLLKAEYQSFSTALVSVLVMMILVLRSLKGGIITMIPNVIPIFITLGLMGLFDIKLNIATVMTAGISIGITVDDSIHYLMKFKKLVVLHKDYEKAILETNKSIGTAVIFTSVVLVLGFGVLGLSNFQPMKNFGAATSFTLFISIFTEIFLMPVLLLKFKPFKTDI
ncbi:MMPL family transporter [bacterium]|nr:MMPL family transporter [bacterium]